VAIWHIRLDAGARVTLPPTRHDGTARTLYCFEGETVTVDGETVEAHEGALVATVAPAELRAPGGAEVLVLQGRPIGEPVAQYGPFVMNDRAGIERAVDDYRRTGFGGWPWPSDEPVHGSDPARFARRPDGTLEDADASSRAT
jgi:redox-sensitive bicupin YhaK (pirin superfamily)